MRKAATIIISALLSGCFSESPTEMGDNDADYFPMTTGSFWEYEVFNIQGERFRIDTIRIESKHSDSGIQVYNISQTFNGIKQQYKYLNNGNDISLYFDSTVDGQRKVFQHRYQNGDSWTTADGDFRVSYFGNHLVGNSLFKSCFKLTSDVPGGFQDWWIVAPNIGVIQKSINGFKYNLNARRLIH